MIESLLTVVLLAYLISGLLKIERFIIYYIPVSFIYDILIINLDKDSAFPVFRGILFTGISLYLLHKLGLPRQIRNISFLIFVFLGHLLLLSTISSNSFKSLSETLKVFDIFSMFLVGVSFYQRGYDLLKLFRISQLVLWIMIINIIVSNTISLGFRGYNDASYYTGAIYANGWYAPTIIAVLQLVLLFSPVTVITQISYKIRKNKLTYLLVFISLVLIALGGRRSAIIIILINILVYIFYSANKYKSFLILSILSLIIILTLPFYSDIIESQYENRLELTEERLENENRYQETELLWTEVLSFNNSLKSLFGENPFLTAGNYGRGALGERYLHVDINIVLFSTGIIGLLVYIFIYIGILMKFKMLYKYFENDKSFLIVICRLIFYSLFLASVAMSFSGGFSAITYRSSTFLILGSIIGYLSFKNKQDAYFKTL